jgi:hypothetical protein
VPRWQYLTLKALVTPHGFKDGQARWSWTYDIGRWSDSYGPLVERLNHGEEAPLMDKLGEDCWELVQIVDARREQFVFDDPYAGRRIEGRLVEYEYWFKRPFLEGSDESS